MIKVFSITKAFAYVPKIKFLGPRSKLTHGSQIHQTSQSKQSNPSIQSQPLIHTGQPSIFLSSLRFPQLTDEEIDIVNMGGARDPPAPKPAKKK